MQRMCCRTPSSRSSVCAYTYSLIRIAYSYSLVRIACFYSLICIRLFVFACLGSGRGAAAASSPGPGRPALCSYFKPTHTAVPQPGDFTDTTTTLRLYGLRHYEWLREPVHDSNCLLAWGPDTLVVAFRGTDSLANVKADLKVGWHLGGSV